MKEVNANAEALKRNYLELTELKHILRKTQSFFEEVRTDEYSEFFCSKGLGYVGEKGTTRLHIHQPR